MVKHIVLWKIRNDAEKKHNIERMSAMLKSLVGKIEGLVSVEIGHNFNPSADYDVALYAEFTDPSALEYYQNHPEHLKCKDFIGSIAISRTATDYFHDDPNTESAPANEKKDDTVKSTSEPEIFVEFPPKRVLEDTPYFKTLRKNVYYPTWINTPKAVSVAGKDYVRKTPTIIVSRPPLWEPEVIEPPADDTVNAPAQEAADDTVNAPAQEAADDTVYAPAQEAADYGNAFNAASDNAFPFGSNETQGNFFAVDEAVFTPETDTDNETEDMFADNGDQFYQETSPIRFGASDSAYAEAPAAVGTDTN